MVKQLQPARTSTLPASSDPAAQAGPARALVEATAPGLLFLLVVLLMVPGTFTLAGAVLSPYRVLLLALFPFLVRRWLADCGGRPAAVDLLVFASFLWIVPGDRGEQRHGGDSARERSCSPSSPAAISSAAP